MARVWSLEKTIHEQEVQLEAKEEEEGEDIQGDLHSYLSDDNDYLEDDAIEFHTDDDDSNFIDDDYMHLITTVGMSCTGPTVS